MKKSILTILLAASTLSLFSQDAKKDSVKTDNSIKDTIVSVQMNINQYRGLIYSIDLNIDSKRASKEIVEFLQKSARIVQPADKPKPQIEEKKQ